MVDIILHIGDSLLLLLLLGTEEGGDSRDGDAPTHDGEGDDAGDKAGEGPEDMLDWVKEIGRFLLVLVPSLPVQGHLIAEDDRGSLLMLLVVMATAWHWSSRQLLL